MISKQRKNKIVSVIFSHEVSAVIKDKLLFDFTLFYKYLFSNSI